MPTQVKRKTPTTKDKLDAAISSLTEEDLKKKYEVLCIACSIGSTSFPLVRSKSWGPYPNQKDNFSLQELLDSQASDSTKLSVIRLKPGELYVYSQYKHPWNDILFRLIAPHTDDEINTLDTEIEKVEEQIMWMEADLDSKADTLSYREGLVIRASIDKYIRALGKIKEKRKKLAYEFDLRLLRKMRRI
jgi:hypothetical protein